MNFLTDKFNGHSLKFIRPGIDQSIDDLKNYFESDEASVNLSNLIDVDRMFSSSEIDYFSRYKPNSRLSLKII